MKNNVVNFGDMPPMYYLVGLINSFNNSFQAKGDMMFDGISWKQVFFLNCIVLFEQPPTIKEMAEIIGCSHQNAKQILSKLEKIDFVKVIQDQDDKRKQRIILTDKANEFRNKFSKDSDDAMQQIFKNINSKDLQTTIKVIQQLDSQLKGE